jgi:hypothetical protein
MDAKADPAHVPRARREARITAVRDGRDEITDVSERLGQRLVARDIPVRRPNGLRAGHSAQRTSRVSLSRPLGRPKRPDTPLDVVMSS